MSKSKKNKKNKGSPESKQKLNRFQPDSKLSRLQAAKGFSSKEFDITAETLPSSNSSDDMNPIIESEEENINRPSERGFNIKEYTKEISVAIVIAIILGIGGWVISHEIKISIADDKINTNTKDIEKNKNSIEKNANNINDLKSDQKLQNYRIEKLEDDNKQHPTAGHSQ